MAAPLWWPGVHFSKPLWILKQQKFIGEHPPLYELDAVGLQFESYPTASCICMLAVLMWCAVP